MRRNQPSSVNFRLRQALVCIGDFAAFLLLAAFFWALWAALPGAEAMATTDMIVLPAAPWPDAVIALGVAWVVLVFITFPLLKGMQQLSLRSRMKDAARIGSEFRGAMSDRTTGALLLCIGCIGAVFVMAIRAMGIGAGAP